MLLIFFISDINITILSVFSLDSLAVLFMFTLPLMLL